MILARTSSGGTTAWYLPDKLGSVRDIVDTSGNVLDHVVYDSFGNIVTETNATNGDRFKFAGMQYDATTGQYYDHARWYNSGTGRFTSQDPMSFAAGDANLYRYVNNDSADRTDTNGLIDPSQLNPSNFQVGPDALNFKTKPGIGEFEMMMQSRYMLYEMNKAWQAHLNGNKNRRKPWEYGRWVRWNRITGQIAVTSIGTKPMGPHGVRFNDPHIAGWEPIGTFHTHFGNGPGAGLGPHRADMYPPDDSPLFPGATFNLNYFKVYDPRHPIHRPDELPDYDLQPPIYISPPYDRKPPGGNPPGPFLPKGQ